MFGDEMSDSSSAQLLATDLFAGATLHSRNGYESEQSSCQSVPTQDFPQLKQLKMLLRSAVDKSTTPAVFESLKTPKARRFYSLPSEFSTPSSTAWTPSTPQTPCPVKSTPTDLFTASAVASRSDKMHALAMMGRPSPLADVNPSDVVAITLKCRRKDLETCGYINWDIISTLQNMEEVGISHSLVAAQEGEDPVVVLDYQTYPLPEDARLQ